MRESKMCNVSLRVDACHQHVTIHAIHLFTFMGGIIMGHQLFLRALPAATKTEQQASSLLA
jgi:hypothetical protein